MSSVCRCLRTVRGPRNAKPLIENAHCSVAERRHAGDTNQARKFFFRNMQHTFVIVSLFVRWCENHNESNGTFFYG